MIMCNQTVTLFYAEYKQGVYTWHKEVLTDAYINANKAYIHSKLGVDSKYKSKIVLTDTYAFMPSKEWLQTDKLIKDTFWSIGVCPKDFIVLGEVAETITDATSEKLVKEKYECHTVSSVDVKKDFTGRIHRIECLGV